MLQIQPQKVDPVVMSKLLHTRLPLILIWFCINLPLLEVILHNTRLNKSI